MSVDAAEAEFLDEPMPESPLKDRLSQALPKAPAGLQWKVGVSGVQAEDIVVTLQSRKGARYAEKYVTTPAYAKEEAQILSLIISAAKDLSEQHTRRCILKELSGVYEGEVA